MNDGTASSDEPGERTERRARGLTLGGTVGRLGRGLARLRPSRPRMTLRARLAVAMATVLVIVLVAAGVTTYVSYRSFVFDRADRALTEARVDLSAMWDRDRAGTVEPGTVEPGTVEPGTRDSGPRGSRSNDSGYYVLVTNADGATVYERLATGPRGTGLRPDLPASLTGPRSDSPTGPARFVTLPSGDAERDADDEHEGEGRGRGDSGRGGEGTDGGRRNHGDSVFRAKVSTLPNGSRLVVATLIDDDLDGLNRLLGIEAAIALVGLAIALVAATLTVRAGLRPLQEVSATAAAIAEGDLERRVPDPGTSDEVGDVSRAMNAMLDRIDELFRQRDRNEERLRRFVADASHELRTPVAGISAYAELFERGAASRPDDLARTMSGIRTETARMSRLIDELLELARLDDGPEGDRLRFEPVELVGLAAEAAETARTVAPDHPVRIVAAGPVETMGSDAQLRRVLDNLLTNLRVHTPAGTTATLEVTADDSGAHITYTDDGPGLPPEAIERVFERFWRADPARSRRQGGSGLGLAIVEAVIASHGGRLSAEAVEPHGLRIRIDLPGRT